MQLFYSDNIQPLFELTREESRHLIKVLRKNHGDTIYFTDGFGGKYLCEIQDDNPKKAGIKVINKEMISNHSPQLTIAIAPTKSMDRLEWFLEKCTEIGITRIIPFVGEHSERRVIKKERLEKILISAMKQSLRYFKPQLDDLCTFGQLMDSSFEGKKYIANLDIKHPNSFKKVYNKGENALIVIGPEGDFSEEELKLASKKGFTKVALGYSRLRTETAGVVACQSFNFLNEE